MKRYAEDVSVDMGFGGEITDEVLMEAQRRLDEAEARKQEKKNENSSYSIRD